MSLDSTPTGGTPRTLSAIPLTEQAQRYLAEVRTVVAGFGVTLLG